MLDKKIEKALNNQINEELFSAYLYAAMVAYFEDQSLKGFAHWMRMQTEEELAHAAKFVQYIQDRGGRVLLKAIEEPQHEWKSPLAAFEAAYGHEQHISGCINKLCDLANKENDNATHNFLEWFVSEQVEEESHASDMVSQLTLVKEAPGGLFMLDREAAKRLAPGAEASAG